MEKGGAQSLWLEKSGDSGKEKAVTGEILTVPMNVNTYHHTQNSPFTQETCLGIKAQFIPSDCCLVHNQHCGNLKTLDTEMSQWLMALISQG